MSRTTAARGVDWRSLVEAFDDRRQADGPAEAAARLAAEGLAPADAATLLSVPESVVRDLLGESAPTDADGKGANHGS